MNSNGMAKAVKILFEAVEQIGLAEVAVDKNPCVPEALKRFYFPKCMQHLVKGAREGDQ